MQFKYILFFVLVISPYICLLLFIAMTLISLLFFSDPVDEKEVQKHFTESELQILSSEIIDKNVTDYEYLSLLAKYANIICPWKINRYTTWTGSRVTSQAYTNLYEVKKDSENIDLEKSKRQALNKIDKNDIDIQRIIRSNRDLIYSYKFQNSSIPLEVVISNDELKAL